MTEISFDYSMHNYINRFYNLFFGRFYVCIGINGKIKSFYSWDRPIGIFFFIGCYLVSAFDELRNKFIYNF